MASVSFYFINKITARTYPDLKSAPVFISLSGPDGNEEIVIHTENARLAARLVKAINSAVDAEFIQAAEDAANAG